jgi:hypothetical protein
MLRFNSLHFDVSTLIAIQTQLRAVLQGLVAIKPQSAAISAGEVSPARPELTNHFLEIW